MAHVVTALDKPSNNKDSQSRYDRRQQNDMLSHSTTLYVCFILSAYSLVHFPTHVLEHDRVLTEASGTIGWQLELLYYRRTDLRHILEVCEPGGWRRREANHHGP